MAADHDWTELDTLVKERYAHGHAHLKMPQALWDAMRARAPKREAKPAWMQSPEELLSRLMSIPIVVDDTLADGEWRLVDTDSDEVLRAGTTTREDVTRG
jgi:hypothetical protein